MSAGNCGLVCGVYSVTRLRVGPLIGSMRDSLDITPDDPHIGQCPIAHRSQFLCDRAGLQVTLNTLSNRREDFPDDTRAIGGGDLNGNGRHLRFLLMDECGGLYIGDVEAFLPAILRNAAMHSAYVDGALGAGNHRQRDFSELFSAGRSNRPL